MSGLLGGNEDNYGGFLEVPLKVSEEFGQYFARIPLVTSPRIVHGNALTLDWGEVLPAARCSYVLGNPPFVGAKFMNDAQRDDTRAVFAGIDNAGLLDFVAAWYVKAARYMQDALLLPLPPAGEGRGEGTPSPAGGGSGWGPAASPIGAAGPSPQPSPQRGEGATAGGTDAPRAAFVSTNSITQGEQVGVLWGWLLGQGVHIHFAHRTFSWTNEARGKAAVHCVIVGFGLQDRPGKVIYEYADIKGLPHAVPAANINPYLVDAPDVVLPRRSKPIGDVPEIGIGSQPIDDGNYLFTTDERDAFIAQEPASAPFFHRWLGSVEFLNGYERWCLWLGDCAPHQLRAMPESLKRVQAVKEFRSKSKRVQTLRAAATPTHFGTEIIPRQPYILLPKVSSEKREFIPFGFMQPETFCSDLVFMLPNGSLFHFGILSSTMHNAWVRAVCGRLKSDFRYSAAIVYNNFPWPFHTPDSEQNQPPVAVQQAQSAIESAAQGVLDARAQFAGSSLADLYDPLTMPPALLRAHQKLDAAVDKAYQLAGGPRAYQNDAERVAFLFTLYQRLTSLLPAAPAPRAARRPRAAAAAPTQEAAAG